MILRRVVYSRALCMPHSKRACVASRIRYTPRKISTILRRIKCWGRQAEIIDLPTSLGDCNAKEHIHPGVSLPRSALKAASRDGTALKPTADRCQLRTTLRLPFVWLSFLFFFKKQILQEGSRFCASGGREALARLGAGGRGFRGPRRSCPLPRGVGGTVDDGVAAGPAVSQRGVSGDTTRCAKTDSFYHS